MAKERVGLLRKANDFWQECFDDHELLMAPMYDAVLGKTWEEMREQLWRLYPCPSHELLSDNFCPLAPVFKEGWHSEGGRHHVLYSATGYPFFQADLDSVEDDDLESYGLAGPFLVEYDSNLNEVKKNVIPGFSVQKYGARLPGDDHYQNRWGRQRDRVNLALLKFSPERKTRQLQRSSQAANSSSEAGSSPVTANLAPVQPMALSVESVDELLMALDEVIGHCKFSWRDWTHDLETRWRAVKRMVPMVEAQHGPYGYRGVKKFGHFLLKVAETRAHTLRKFDSLCRGGIACWLDRELRSPLGRMMLQHAASTGAKRTALEKRINAWMTKHAPKDVLPSTIHSLQTYDWKPPELPKKAKSKKTKKTKKKSQRRKSHAQVRVHRRAKANAS